MNMINTEIPDVVIIEPKIFADDRGWFFESFNSKSFSSQVAQVDFVQDNHSKSRKQVLRGLHYQIQQPQGKLVRVVSGEIFDVVVDIRKSSPTFGRCIGASLSADSHNMIWVPVGFAHGFCVVSDYAEVLYKSTDFYAPEHERSIRWNDPA